MSGLIVGGNLELTLHCANVHADVSGKGVRANTLRLCPHWTANLGGDEGKLDQELAALEKLVDNWDCIPKVLLGWAVKK